MVVVKTTLEKLSGSNCVLERAKHMREAGSRWPRLELEYAEALGRPSNKRQEIEALQEAEVVVKGDYEGVIQLLEAKVRELEQQCQAQSQQFDLLSGELRRLRLGPTDTLLLNTDSSVSKNPIQLKNGAVSSLPRGSQGPPAEHPVMCEEIRALPMSGVKPDPLSVTPPLHPSSPGQDQLPEQMNVEIDSGNPKMKYTGRVRLCVARYSYNPYTGPNEHPEAELPLRAGKYLYVYGNMDEDGFYQGELMDGRRGLVPSNFVALLQDDDSLAQPADLEMCRNLLLNSDTDIFDAHLRGLELLPDPRPGGLLPGQPQATVPSSTGALDVNIDEVGEDVVPYPRRISLIKQLGRSVIVGWEPASVPPGRGAVLSYNVLVDKEVRVNVPAGGRTKVLIEKLSLADFTYRICVQSLTERGSSDELRCTLQVGKDVCVAPTHLKVESIAQMTAEISWQPSNSNYDHVVFLNEQEYDVVKSTGYKYTFYNLRPCTTCTVRVLARPHQVPWQLPLEQRERREATVEFCTLPTGPPAPPEDVSVQVGSAPGTLRISWKVPVLTSMGTSNGARVTGYSVCAKGQRVAEVKLPTAESVTVDYLRIQNLETREIIVRTVSAQGESEDSCAAPIPTELLGLPSCQPWTPARTRPSTSLPDQPASPLLQREGPWGQAPPSPHHGPTLGPTAASYSHRGGTGRSPSPQRILPQPQGAPIPSTVAKAMAREAAQKVTERTKAERASTFQQEISDEEEASYDTQSSKRPGGSVDDFLRHSELGRQHSGHGDNELSESSRGSDLSDILEEDEEELYSEMQLEEGGRRKHSTTAHTALKMLGSTVGHGRMSDRTNHTGRRASHGSSGHRVRPMTVPSIEITVDSNSEGGRSLSGIEGPISPSREETYYRHVPGRRRWPHQRTSGPEHRYDSHHGRERLSPEQYKDPKPKLSPEDQPTRIFVALFDYDPFSMSPNPDAAEELPFTEGQIIQVHGTKDADGFYHGETGCRVGLIPCNMVSEIQADSEEMVEQLVKQGFLPLNTRVETIGVTATPERCKESAGSVNRRSRKTKRERNRRTSRTLPVPSRRMVALYDYDPRESSPNVDVEAELTFCAGDIISVWGELDEDGFYYGEINGHKGLVPSNFLEEVPDDVEVYLSDVPSRYPHEGPSQGKSKRVPGESTQRRATSPTAHAHHGSALVDGTGSPVCTRDMASKKKKGLLSKGKKLLRKLGGVM